MPSLLRTNKEIAEIYDRQIDTVYRVCYSFMKNAPETEDTEEVTTKKAVTAFLFHFR